MDTCATVSEYTVGRRDKRRGDDGLESVLKMQQRGDGHALVHTDLHNLFEVLSFSH